MPPNGSLLQVEQLSLSESVSFVLRPLMNSISSETQPPGSSVTLESWPFPAVLYTVNKSLSVGPIRNPL